MPRRKLSRKIVAAMQPDAANFPRPHTFDKVRRLLSTRNNLSLSFICRLFPSSLSVRVTGLSSLKYFRAVKSCLSSLVILSKSSPAGIACPLITTLGHCSLASDALSNHDTACAFWSVSSIVMFGFRPKAFAQLRSALS